MAKNQLWILANSQLGTEALSPTVFQKLDYSNHSESLEVNPSPVGMSDEIPALADCLLLPSERDPETEDRAKLCSDSRATEAVRQCELFELCGNWLHSNR